MNRNVTNVIRFFMDEWIPAAIRDSRWFMYPFFYLAYRGRNIREVMEFKSRVYSFTPAEYDSSTTTSIRSRATGRRISTVRAWSSSWRISPRRRER